MKGFMNQFQSSLPGGNMNIHYWRILILLWISVTCSSRRRGKPMRLFSTTKSKTHENNSVRHGSLEDYSKAAVLKIMKSIAAINANIQIEEEVVCTNKTVNQCSEVSKTKYEPKKIDRCNTHFKKTCHIEYFEFVVNETVENCEECFPKICQKILVPKCFFWVCNPHEIEVCEPEDEECVDGKKCNNETVPLKYEIPQETCTVVPEKVCEKVVKFFPTLYSEYECEKKLITECDLESII